MTLIHSENIKFNRILWDTYELLKGKELSDFIDCYIRFDLIIMGRPTNFFTFKFWVKDQTQKSYNQ